MKIITAVKLSVTFALTGMSTIAIAATNQIYSDDVIEETIAQNNWHYYQIRVDDPSKLTVKLRKISDDVDLYVAKSQKPSEDNFVCAPQKTGNMIETCRLTSNIPSVWYIGVHGKADSDYQLGVRAESMKLISQINN
jgi:hypothetical protein